MDNKGSIFTSVEKKRQKRSNFNLSHDLKLSLDMGSLIPTYVQEVIPGDKITISTTQMMRLAPLISPVMHKINIYQEYFFVPNRILWGNWETFITGSKNGKQLSADELPAFPTVNPYAYDGEVGNWYPTNMENGTSSLVDYMGLPTREQFPHDETTGETELAGITTVSALPFAAYQRIFDEYYRDENLMTSMYDSDDPNIEAVFENYNQLQDGNQSVEIQNALSNLNVRAWQHDYFTSALPWAQKGEEVKIPIDLELKEAQGQSYMYNGTKIYNADTGESFDEESPLRNHNSGAVNSYLEGQNPDTSWDNAVIDNSDSLANISTINDLRAAVKLQEWLETNARGGSRYFESIYAHFGVQSPDSRLQRPEFIGSNRSNMVISEVMQTSSPQSENDTPQGNLAGHGQAVGSTKDFRYYAQEHGYIIGITSVLPNTAYQQGIPKHFLKFEDRLQYYFPEFAHLGEQEITNQEIYAGGGTGQNAQDPTGTFGYIPRYSEYKFINSRVAGDFRDTLSFWHMGRIFDTPPKLNDIFIGADPTKRIFAVQDIPQDGNTEPGDSIRNFDSIYAHIFHDVKASRLMPKYGTPTI